jgi:hypothetical protein
MKELLIDPMFASRGQFDELEISQRELTEVDSTSKSSAFVITHLPTPAKDKLAVVPNQLVVN